MSRKTAITDNVSIDIVKATLSEKRSLSELLRGFRSLETYTTEGKKEAGYSLLTKDVWQFIFNSLDLTAPHIPPPRSISAFNGLFQFMVNKNRSSIDKFWRYYSILHTTYHTLNFFDNTGHSISNNTLTSVTGYETTSKYLVTFGPSKTQNMYIISAYTSHGPKNLKLLAQVETDSISDLDIAETVDGLIVIHSTPKRFISIYRLIGNELKFIRQDGQFSNVAEDIAIAVPTTSYIFSGLGYTGYYARGRIRSYKDEPDRIVSFKSVGKVPKPTIESGIKLYMLFYSVSTDGVGVDVIGFKAKDTDELTYLFCKTELGTVRVLWSTDEKPMQIIDSFVIYPNKVVDILTGDVLMTLEGIKNNADESIIEGVTRKDDGTGYYLWLNYENTNYGTRLSIMNYLQKSAVDTKELFFDYEPLPETQMHLGATGNEEALIRLYYDEASGFIEGYSILTERSLDLPFPVYSFYSLYPYYHYIKTQQRVLVIAFDHAFDYFKVIGYSIAGHRISESYSINAFDVTELNIKFPNLLYINTKNTGLVDLVYRWITEYLQDFNYINASKEDKMAMIKANK